MLSLLLLSSFPSVLSVDMNRPPAVYRREFGQVVSDHHNLGTIKDGRGRVVYHVVTKFWTVKAALVSHGHSAVFFYNNRWMQVAKYEVGLHEALPVKLTNNTLFFSYVGKTKEKQTHSQVLGTVLPKFPCVAPADCYTRQ